MITIKGLHALAEALAHIDIAATQGAVLGRAAQRIETTVKLLLSRRPGEDHTYPWYRMGALHDSIAHETEADRAVIGSTDPVAVYQELGTRTDPPRPFLAVVAAGEAETIAHEIGAAVASTLREALR